MALGTFHACFALAWVALPLIVLVNLDRGIDVTDTGYYYVSIANLRDITIQTTQFAVVWNLLPLPDSIVWHRIAAWLLLMASAGFLFDAAWRLAWPAARQSRTERVALWALAAGGASAFYYTWLPDPSYDAIGLIASMCLIGLACLAAARVRARSRFPYLATCLWGFTLVALAYTRPPAALGLGICVPAMVLFVARPPIATTVKMALWALSGGALFVLAAGVLVEPPMTTLSRLLGGLERRELLERNFSFASSFDSFEAQARVAIEKYGVFALASVLADVAARVLRRAAIAKRAIREGPNGWAFAAWLALEGLGVAAWVGLLGRFYIDSDGFNARAVYATAEFVFVLGSIALLTLLARAAIPVGEAEDAARNRGLLGVGLLVLIAQLALVAGTGSRPFNMLTIYSALGLLALVLALSRNGELIRPGASTAAMVALATLLVVVHGHMRAEPYRLPAPLTAQTEPVDLRHGRSTLRTDSPTRDFLAAFEEAAGRIAAFGRAPVLLDLTGRLPLVTYHIGARPAFTPWALSGHPGSQAHFDAIVRALPENDIDHAWILDAPALDGRFATTALEERGRSLAHGYHAVARAQSAYLQTEVVLLAPTP